MALLLSAIAAAALAVPPDALPANHNQPYHGGDPVVRVFERWPDDDHRQHAWECYAQHLDQAWQRYRAAGSTPEAWAFYKHELALLKRTYVYGDIYLVGYEAPPACPVRNPGEQAAPPEVVRRGLESAASPDVPPRAVRPALPVEPVPSLPLP